MYSIFFILDPIILKLDNDEDDDIIDKEKLKQEVLENMGQYNNGFLQWNDLKPSKRDNMFKNPHSNHNIDFDNI
jgi:hypothetical protein